MPYVNREFNWDFTKLRRFYDNYIVKWLNSTMSWTAAQMKQARANLGFGNGDIATGADFDNPDATNRAKVLNLGAALDGMNDGVYDVSKRYPTGGPNSDGKFTLEYILANANTLIPTSRRHGGMEICFVHSSDNKYVQFRYMSTSTAAADFTNVANWQGVDDEPIAGSNNLVKSGGVYDGIGKYVGILSLPATGAGTTMQTMAFETIIGHVYRVYLHKGTWDVTGIGQNVVVFVIRKDNTDVQGTDILAKNISSRPDYFDITAEEGSYTVNVRAANGTTVITKITDLSENTIASHQVKDEDNIANLQTDCAYNIEKDMQPISECVITDSGDINDNQSFESYAIYNKGFKHIYANVGFHSVGSSAISFWSGEKIINDNLISVIPCKAGGYNIYDADIPSNCVLIVVTSSVSFLSDIWVKVVDGNPYLENIVNNIYSAKSGDELVLYKENVNNGYLSAGNTKVVLSRFNDGQSVFTKNKYAVTPNDILLFTNSENYTIGFWWYAKDGSFLTADWFETCDKKTVPNNAYYCIFAFRKSGLNSNNFTGVSIRKTKLKDIIEIEQGDITLDKDSFENGYIGTTDVHGASDKIYTPYYIKVVPGGDYKIVSDEVSRVTVHWYDADKQFIAYDDWNITEKEFRVPKNVSYIRVTFNNTNLQVETLTNSVEIVRVYPLPSDNTYFAGGQREKERYLTAHLFINESVAGNNVIIPSQSLADIAISAKLGFLQIEFNVHRTSDNVLVCMHGSDGKFGKQVVHVDGATDISNISFDGVTYAWITENVRYVSNYAKYRTTIPTLEDALIACTIYGIRPLIGLNTYNDDSDRAAVELAKKHFGNNFSVGAYGDSQAKKVRKYWKGNISNWSDTITLADVIRQCNIIGAPYSHIVSNTALDTITDDADLITLAKAVHETGCKVGFAQSYVSASRGEELVSYGFEAGGSAWNIPLFDNGNIGNFFDNKTFNQFVTTGTVTGGVLELANGDTVDNVLTDSVFVGGGVVYVWFIGTISISIGRYISGASFTSDGKNPLVLTAMFLDEVPALHITASASTTINGLTFKVNQFE